MKLISKKIHDIHLVSCLVQDAITMLDWMDHKQKKFDLYLNRFCWEDKAEKSEKYRTNSMLCINNAEKAMVKNAPKARNVFKTLLACLCKSKHEIHLVFDDSFEIILSGKNLNIQLEDLTEKWPTTVIPFHSFSQA